MAGTIIPAPVLTVDDIRRFWSKVAFSPDGCCLWTDKPANHGYGVIAIARKVYQAHVMARYLATGVWPSGLYTCHTCDVPLCCRPSHLFVGTQADNVRDAIAKGRRCHMLHPERMPRGERSGVARLTEKLVRELRQRYASETIGYKQLAEEYGVGRNTVFCAVRRRTWTHVV